MERRGLGGVSIVAAKGLVEIMTYSKTRSHGRSDESANSFFTQRVVLCFPCTTKLPAQKSVKGIRLRVAARRK